MEQGSSRNNSFVSKYPAWVGGRAWALLPCRGSGSSGECVKHKPHLVFAVSVMEYCFFQFQWSVSLLYIRLFCRFRWRICSTASKRSLLSTQYPSAVFPATPFHRPIRSNMFVGPFNRRPRRMFKNIFFSQNSVCNCRLKVITLIHVSFSLLPIYSSKNICVSTWLT